MQIEKMILNANKDKIQTHNQPIRELEQIR